MQAAFETLLGRLTSAPVSLYENFNESFIVATDEPGKEVGSVLAQKHSEGNVHPIKFPSRTINSAGRKYSNCEREAMAVIFFLRTFRVYLLSYKMFSVLTDYKSFSCSFLKRDVYGWFQTVRIRQLFGTRMTNTLEVILSEEVHSSRKMCDELSSSPSMNLRWGTGRG